MQVKAEIWFATPRIFRRSILYKMGGYTIEELARAFYAGNYEHVKTVRFDAKNIKDACSQVFAFAQNKNKKANWKRGKRSMAVGDVIKIKTPNFDSEQWAVAPVGFDKLPPKETPRREASQSVVPPKPEPPIQQPMINDPGSQEQPWF